MKVLLVRAGALGDVLLLRRSVAGLKRAGHGVCLLAPAPSGAALVGGGVPDVDGLIAWDRAEAAALLTEEGVSPGPFRDELRGFGAAVAFTRSAALASGLKALIPRVLVHDPQPAAGAGHASHWLARPLAALGVAACDPPPHTPTAEEDAAAGPILDRMSAGFLAVHAGGGSASKKWPWERFAALVEARAGGRPWLLVEGPAEAPSAPPSGAVLARELPPRVLGAVLARAGLYVGNDSGVSHLAAAWGAPTVTLFGPTDPDVWAPVGADVRVLRSRTGRMEEIAVEDVLAAT